MRPFVTTREYAAELGALAFFEEKYGEFVRVLEIDDFSRELCGGTHVSWTSEIGLLKITASQSVGANTRRLEAITSAKAIEHYRDLEQTVRRPRRRARRQARPRRGGRRQARRRAQGAREEAQGGRERRGPRPPRRRCWPASRTIGGVPVVAAQPGGRSGRRAADARRRGPRAPAGRGRAARRRRRTAARRSSSPLSDAAVGRGVHAQEVLKAMAAGRRRQGRRQADAGARRRRQRRTASPPPSRPASRRCASCSAPERCRRLSCEVRRCE